MGCYEAFDSEYVPEGMTVFTKKDLSTTLLTLNRTIDRTNAGRLTELTEVWRLTIVRESPDGRVDRYPNGRPRTFVGYNREKSETIDNGCWYKFHTLIDGYPITKQRSIRARVCWPAEKRECVEL